MGRTISFLVILIKIIGINNRLHILSLGYLGGKWPISAKMPIFNDSLHIVISLLITVKDSSWSCYYVKNN